MKYKYTVILYSDTKIPEDVIIEQLEQWMQIDEEPIDGVWVKDVLVEDTKAPIVGTSYPYGY